MGPRAGRSGLLALVALLVVAQSFPGGVTPAVAGHPYHHHHGGVSVSVGFGYGWPNYGYGYGYGYGERARDTST